jgi:hypothetical protein
MMRAFPALKLVHPRRNEPNLSRRAHFRIAVCLTWQVVDQLRIKTNSRSRRGGAVPHC